MKEEKVEWFFKLRGFPIMRLLMHEVTFAIHLNYSV